MANPPSPEVNTLDVDQRWTYANTFCATWQVIKFLSDLQPVNGDMELEDRNCDICREDFTTDFHRAVRLPCNHIFGKTCIERWLRPYASLEPSQGESGLSLGANSCPKCRRVFTPQQRAIDSLLGIEIRIRFWDLAYAHVGIALSEREAEAREDLLRYLGSYCGRGSDEFFPYFTEKIKTIVWAQNQLLRFSLSLKRYFLTGAQEHLRRRLEEIGRHGFPGRVRCWRNDHDELCFEVGHNWGTVQNSESDKSEEFEKSVEVEGAEESDVLTGGETEGSRR